MAKSVKIATEKYIKGMLSTPFIPCPVCGRKTRAIYTSKCQWCETKWNEAQLKERQRRRTEQINIYRREGLLE